MQGAAAVAVIKNNRLNEIIIKNPGAGYSSGSTVTLKSEFNYVVNLDLNYLQFNFLTASQLVQKSNSVLKMSVVKASSPNHLAQV